MQKYEYNFDVDANDGHGLSFSPMEDGRYVRQQGEAHRSHLEARGCGGTVTFLRRPVGEWEVVERAEIPARADYAPPPAVGDVVRLRSGGPDMEVVAVAVHPVTYGTIVSCRWEGGRADFDATTLDLVRRRADPPGAEEAPARVGEENLRAADELVASRRRDDPPAG